MSGKRVQVVAAGLNSPSAENANLFAKPGTKSADDVVIVWYRIAGSRAYFSC